MVDLRKGDCLELLKSLQDNSVDLVVTDPPFGVNFQSHRRKEKYEHIQNDDNLEFLPELMVELNRVLKPDTHIYMFCVFKTIDVFKQEFEKYFELKNIIIWNKGNFGTGNYYRFKYEMVLFGQKGNKPMKNHSFADVLDCNGTGNEFHPTQKPIDLLKIFIQNSSDENGVVLDTFMGSGSTGIACKQLNRNFIGFEIDDEYFRIAQERIEKGIATKSTENAVNTSPLFI